MKYFVTGGSGFIGSNFIDYVLQDKENAVVNYSRHTYAMNPRVLEHLESEERYKFVAGDILNGIFLLQTIQETKPDYIVHFAASTHVDRSFLYPEEFFRSNTYGTFTLLEVLRNLIQKPRTLCVSTESVFGDVPPPKMLYVSTDEVFGEVFKGYCKELDHVAPRNPYSASKAAAEMFVNAYFHSYQVPTVIVRLMNNYGPRQHPEKLIGKIITRSLMNKPFTLFEGGSIRGWIYVKDSCEAIHKVLSEGVLGETYHVPPSGYKNVSEVAETILNIMGKKQLFLGFKDRRLKDDERYALSGEKMKKEFDWIPPTTFEDGMKQTIKWFSKNPWFWKHVYAP